MPRICRSCQRVFADRYNYCAYCGKELEINYNKSYIPPVSNQEIKKELENIKVLLIDHDENTDAQYIQSIGFAVLALSLALIIPALTPDISHFAAGIILLLLSNLLLFFAVPISKFGRTIDHKLKMRKRKNKS